MIKKILLYFAYAIFFLSIRQVFLWPGDTLLLLVIFCGLYERMVFGLVITLLLGMMVDVTSYAHFGTFIFSFGVLFAFLRFLRNKIEFEVTLSRFYWICIFTFFVTFLSWLWVSLVGSEPRPFWIYMKPKNLDWMVTPILGLFWFRFLKVYTDLSMEHLVEMKDQW